MKAFRFFIWTIAAFFIFSCSQLNLKNSSGSVSVALPGADTRSFVAEGESAEDFENVTYRISLYSTEGSLVEEKTALPGEVIEFSEVAEGSYVLPVFCYGTRAGSTECIAFGNKGVEVQAGEVTAVEVPLYYNRISIVDVEKSSIEYSGTVFFDSLESLEAYAKSEIFNYISAELILTNGWIMTEPYYPADDNITAGELTKKEVSDVSGKDEYEISFTWREKFTDTINLYVTAAASGGDVPESVTCICEYWTDVQNAVSNAQDDVTTICVLTGDSYEVSSSGGITIPSGKKICITTTEDNPAEIYLSNDGGLTSFFDVSGVLTVSGGSDGFISFTTNHNDKQLTLAGSAIAARSGSKVNIGNNVSFSKITTNGTGGAALYIDSGAQCYVTGYVSFDECCVSSENGCGGAVYNNGTLMLSGTSMEDSGLINFTSCTAPDESGSSYGGAVYSAGSININNCKFDSNEANTDGGAVYIANGILVLENSIFTGNGANGYANDIYFTGYTLSLIGKITHEKGKGTVESLFIYTDKEIMLDSSLDITDDNIVIVLTEENFNSFKESGSPVVSAYNEKISVKYYYGAGSLSEAYSLNEDGSVSEE